MKKDSKDAARRPSPNENVPLFPVGTTLRARPQQDLDGGVGIEPEMNPGASEDEQ